MKYDPYVIKFVREDKSKSKYSLPICTCGKVSRSHYEICRKSEIPKDDSIYVVEIICKDCFEKVMERALEM